MLDLTESKNDLRRQLTDCYLWYLKNNLTAFCLRQSIHIFKISKWQLRAKITKIFGLYFRE